MTFLAIFKIFAEIPSAAVAFLGFKDLITIFISSTFAVGKSKFRVSFRLCLTELVVLNATSVGVGRRNRSFLCMCSRNCIFDIIIIIIIINIALVAVVLMLQNRQVMVTLFNCCWYSGGIPSRSEVKPEQST